MEKIHTFRIKPKSCVHKDFPSFIGDTLKNTMSIKVLLPGHTGTRQIMITSGRSCGMILPNSKPSKVQWHIDLTRQGPSFLGYWIQVLCVAIFKRSNAIVHIGWGKLALAGLDLAQGRVPRRLNNQRSEKDQLYRRVE